VAGTRPHFGFVRGDAPRLRSAAGFGKRLNEAADVVDRVVETRKTTVSSPNTWHPGHALRDLAHENEKKLTLCPLYTTIVSAPCSDPW